MQINGIVRRIDDLGRIVIPKEIRKALKLKKGDNLEIGTTENDKIILKKYNQIDKLKEISQTLINSIYQIIKKDIIITNTDKVIVATKKKYKEKELSKDLVNIMIDRKEKVVSKESKINIIETPEENNYIIMPIITNGDIIGSAIIVSEKITENDHNLIKIIAYFLSKHIEED